MILERRTRQTPRLRLEAVGPEHADGLFAVAVASREHLLPWMPWAVEHDIANVHQFIARAAETWQQGTGYDHAMVLDGRPVGIIALMVAHGGVGELGYWIAADAAGKGLVTEASLEVLRIGFEELELYRVELRAGVDNVRSLRVAEKLGFTREGRLRNGLGGSEGPFDAYIHGMTPGDWSARRSASAVT